MSSRERIGDVMRFGRFMARFSYLFTEEMARTTLGPLIERVVSPPDVERFKADSAEHAARVGIKAAHYGRHIREPEVELMGGAMAVTAAVRAEADDEVPTDTVEGIVMSIVEADIDPAMNPLLDDEVASKIDELVYEVLPTADSSPSPGPNTL